MGICHACGNCCNCDFTPADKSVPQDATWQTVRLAVSPVAIKVFQMQAYHSSVAVNDVEFSFTKQGLIGAPLFHSHFQAKGPLQVLDMGLTDVPASRMLAALEPFFTSGSYDILRKNCNAFSDCALFYLLGARLDEKYRAIEEFGTSVDRFGLVRLITMFDYRPNPLAEGFRLDQVLEHVGSQRHLDASFTESLPPSTGSRGSGGLRSVQRSSTGSVHASYV
mmetsp:Transcript_114897/g.357945  ORF Transcript_114897/g.357945 Transcript_114897/m.357945 type:complete len:222 (+) Transcript_114897:71-736(+)